ncbi:MAG: GIY-YIG nuclease family protein [Halioglobus sp.]
MKNALVIGQLEDVSWEVLEEYSSVIKSMVAGKSGIYALYRKEKLYYVGLANNLPRRLKQHLNDRHSKKWNRISIYLTQHDEHMKEL